MNIIEFNLKKQLQTFVKDLFDIGLSFDEVKTERTRIPALGDYTTSVALILEKKYKLPPDRVQGLLCDKLQSLETYQDINLSGPGFINVKMSKSLKLEVFEQIDKLVTDSNFEPLVIKLDEKYKEKFISQRKRLKNIIHVLTEEAIIYPEVMVCKWSWPISIEKEVLILYHISQALGDQIEIFDTVDEGIMTNSIKDLIVNIEKIDSQVVYRKLDQSCLGVVGKIYCQLDLLFDKMIIEC